MRTVSFFYQNKLRCWAKVTCYFIVLAGSGWGMFCVAFLASYLVNYTWENIETVAYSCKIGVH